VAACDPANRSSDKAASALGGSDGRRAAAGSHFCGDSDGNGGGVAIGGAVRAALGWSALDRRFAFGSWVAKDLLRLWSGRNFLL
jgi:hypothetical protein